MIPQEVDVIVAGGGPAGCVVAGRLAYADPNLQVLLIEAGANNQDDPWVYRPAIYVKNMQRIPENTKAEFFVDSRESSFLRGRKSIVPCASILGGGSSINFQMYTRASASDWDDFKMEGWTAKDLLPLMKRLERYQKPNTNDTHGYDGPIAISNGGRTTDIAQDFIRAAAEQGVPFNDDIQDNDTAHGSELWAKYIDKYTGRRSDAATAYVHSVRANQTNLHLLCNSKVSRVVFEGTKAVGVAYVSARNHDGENYKETIVRARKQVVVSAGTLNTPLILERSGLGDAKHLKSLGVQVVSDLPGVGEEYQDHYTTLSIFRASQESTTADDFLRGNTPDRAELFRQWETRPDQAAVSSNVIDAGFKIRPTEEELKTMGPEFNEFWDRVFKDKPDKPVMFGSVVSGAYADHTVLPPGKYFTMFQYLEIPASRGRTHISSKNPYAAPHFDSGFMNDKADFAPIRWSYKKTREVARRMDCFRGELTSHHPHFHPASKAAAIDIDIETARKILPESFTTGIHMGTWHKPGQPYEPNRVIKDIEYTKEDDDCIDDWIADHVETTWHSLGTCAMRARAKGGVVDKNLNVYGTSNLKCIDLSICPENLCTNTYSSALLVGEKGADLVAADLGLKISTPHPLPPHYKLALSPYRAGAGADLHSLLQAPESPASPVHAKAKATA